MGPLSSPPDFSLAYLNSHARSTWTPSGGMILIPANFSGLTSNPFCLYSNGACIAANEDQTGVANLIDCIKLKRGVGARNLKWRRQITCA